MIFTGDITLGNILTIVTLIGIAITFGIRLGAFETTLKSHGKALVEVSTRLDKHEDRILRLVESLQAFSGFKVTMSNFADTLSAIAERLNKHEDRILVVVEKMQRLMGQSEVLFRNREKS